MGGTHSLATNLRHYSLVVLLVSVEVKSLDEKVNRVCMSTSEGVGPTVGSSSEAPSMRLIAVPI